MHRGRGARVHPRLGRLVLFFGRDAEGAVDPRSWHRGDPVLPPPEPLSSPTEVAFKGTVVLFKEVPLEEFETEVGFQAAAAARRSATDKFCHAAAAANGA